LKDAEAGSLACFLALSLRACPLEALERKRDAITTAPTRVHPLIFVLDVNRAGSTRIASGAWAYMHSHNGSVQ
jgi:hypothetical protein